MISPYLSRLIINTDLACSRICECTRHIGFGSSSFVSSAKNMRQLPSCIHISSSYSLVRAFRVLYKTLTYSNPLNCLGSANPPDQTFVFSQPPPTFAPLVPLVT